MVDAHMDELGGMIRRVTPRGLLTMQMLGGWLDQALVDQRWIIIGSKGPVRAVTGIRDVHVVPADERTRVFPRDSLFLDVGATSEAEVAAMGISPGDPVVPDAPFTVLNGTDNYLAKGWDDRVGCGVIIEAMRRLAHAAAPEPDLLDDHDAGRSRPARRGSRGRRREAGARDCHRRRHHRRRVSAAAPRRRRRSSAPAPASSCSTRRRCRTASSTQLVKQTAAAKKLPLQIDLVQGYGDDSAEMQRSNGGVPTVNLVVPIRYTHAHNGDHEPARLRSDGRAAGGAAAEARRGHSGAIA